MDSRPPDSEELPTVPHDEGAPPSSATHVESVDRAWSESPPATALGTEEEESAECARERGAPSTDFAEEAALEDVEAYEDEGPAEAAQAAPAFYDEAEDDAHAEVAEASTEDVVEKLPPPELAGAWTAARGPELLDLARTWAIAREDVTVDCARLERLDVATLQILLALQRDLSTHGHALTLVDIPPPVVKTIRLGGLEGELLACP